MIALVTLGTGFKGIIAAKVGKTPKRVEVRPLFTGLVIAVVGKFRHVLKQTSNAVFNTILSPLVRSTPTKTETFRGYSGFVTPIISSARVKADVTVIGSTIVCAKVGKYRSEKMPVKVLFNTISYPYFSTAKLTYQDAFVKVGGMMTVLFGSALVPRVSDFNTKATTILNPYTSAGINRLPAWNDGLQQTSTTPVVQVVQFWS